MVTFRARVIGVSLALLVLSAGCGKRDSSREGIDPGADVAASTQVSDSFIVKKDASGRLRIALKKSALEKEFLLQTAVIQQTVAPLGSGVKSRVVAFRKRDGKLYLVEATQGHTVTHEFPQTLLLASYPILEETSEAITFDFNAGMSRLYLDEEWNASDSGGTSYTPGLTPADVDMSYLDKAVLNSANQLEVRQVTQLINPAAVGTDKTALVEARYYISPYHPDPSFEPMLSPGFDRMGFFEVAPQLGNDGRSIVRVAKFNTAKPIVFAISFNTPPEYRQAVKDGVLYWNRALANQPIQVIDAPPGVTAPDINYNVVQWVDWETAGYAYADAQMDPRSGEVLHAQVFIPSTFAYPEKAMAKILIEKVKTGPLNKHRLQGFDSVGFCALDAETLFANGSGSS